MIYADNAATTKMSRVAIDTTLKYMEKCYGNPSSLHSVGQEAAEALENARKTVVDCLGCLPQEIIFTSGGSEADNQAIISAAEIGAKKGKKHIISSVFEHHAVLHTLKALEKQGFEVTLLPVYEDGLVRVEDLKAAIREETALVTIMMANNEIGTVQPIRELSGVCKEAGVLFHTDAVQAVGHIPVNVEELGVDLLSLSAHKFHGPKGVGALYIRRGVVPAILIDGGAQERSRRAGTENVAAIVGLGEAITLAVASMEENAKKLSALRDRFMDGALAIERSRVNGSREHRLPGNVNMCFEGIEGESLLLMLDMNGICASSGSACTSGSLDPSHVLLSIGLPHEIAHGSLRLSFGEETTLEDVDYILEVLPPIVDRLRAMSPLWERIVKENA